MVKHTVVLRVNREHKDWYIEAVSNIHGRKGLNWVSKNTRNFTKAFTEAKRLFCIRNGSDNVEFTEEI